jgi:cyclopropane fatty-acyl-phospholipid synthase-like methyltransferase
MMNPDFYSRVADEFGEYTSGGLRTDVFPDGDPEVAFDELARGLGGPDRRLVDVGCADGRSLLRIAPAFGSALGIDMSASMLESAERMREQAGRATSGSSSATVPLPAFPPGRPLCSPPGVGRCSRESSAGCSSPVAI